MLVGQAMEVLGIRRAIWIDDYFESSRSALVDVIFGDDEFIRGLGVKGVLTSEYDPEGQTIRKYLDQLSAEERTKLHGRYLAERAEREEMPAKELANDAFSKTGILLGVAKSDRLTFEAAAAEIPRICEAGDDHIGYIVDLSNGAIDPRAGLDVIGQLSDHNSKGTFFILTHEAAAEGESKLESELREEFSRRYAGSEVPPICVISKQRIDETFEDEARLAESINIALKRAGLRKGVHGVLAAARRVVQKSFDQAASVLLEIPPEQLDKFLVERAGNEGVSELHVVERAISANISDSMRKFFMTESEVLDNSKKLRSLRGIEIKPGATSMHKGIADFRKLEIWEDGETLNESHAPISCGDVFVLDGHEFRGNEFAEKRFVLLGQQCDLQLRGGGKRAIETAYFVPLEVVSGGGGDASLKSSVFPFLLNGARWRCNFRDATSVRLSILDLASFRHDGRVSFSMSQVEGSMPSMLSGLESIYESRVGQLSVLLATQTASGTLRDIKCQLTFSDKKPFNSVHLPKFALAEKTQIRGEKVVLEKRVTWCIRREGRIKNPYSSAVLKDFLAVSGRHAFDLDFANDESCGTACKA